MGAAGLALLTIEGPQTVMVVADYLRKKLIEPLDERREERRNRLRKEGEARNQAAWEAWNERRLAAEANGETFDEPPPGTSSDKSE